jgi:transposase InsO family protein
MAKIYEFVHNTTTIYHPQSNGAIERMNRVIAGMLFNLIEIKGPVLKLLN